MTSHVFRRASARTRTFALAVAGALVASMLAVNPAAGSSGPTNVAELETALCDQGGATVPLTQNISGASDTLTIAKDCDAVLDLAGFELIVANVMIVATWVNPAGGGKLTIRDSSVPSSGVLRAQTGATVAGRPGIAVYEVNLGTNRSSLVIESGEVRANGGENAAGIGGFCPSVDSGGDCDHTNSSGSRGGDITISGGTVVVRGGQDAAGIGGGYRGNMSGVELLISDAFVNATGGARSAGIGGGFKGWSGTVRISNSEVFAVGGTNAPGIGSGAEGGGGQTLQVAGGTLTASAGAGFPEPSVGASHLANLEAQEFEDGVRVRCAVIVNTFNPVRTTVSFNTGCLAPSEGTNEEPSQGPSQGPIQDTSGGVTAAPSAEDRAASVAVEAASAAGVAGSSAAVLVRNGEVVPVTSSSATGVGPRGGVVLEAEGLQVSVAAVGGASPDTGVVTPVGGEIVCELCAAFAAGSTIEAWMYSSPQLAAAVQVPDDHADGDCILLRIPTGAPLTGDPVEAGAHTLQLRMYAQDGPEVLATGVTVGTAVPSSIPAGEGPADRGLLGVFGLLAVAGALAVRRQVVTG